MKINPGLIYFVLEVLLIFVVETPRVFPAKDDVRCAGDLGLFLWMGLALGGAELFGVACTGIWEGRPTSGLTLLLRTLAANAKGC